MAKRTFYSKSSGLTISPPHMKGSFQNVDGESKRVGETIIQFVPMGGQVGYGISDSNGRKMEFGSYVTEDPKEIEYLEKRSAETGDVFGPEEFNRLSTPPEIRAESSARKVEDQNRLIEQLQAQLASKGAPDKPLHAPTK